MKVSDYIVDFFVDKDICDFFGYQGTMIAHFVDSIGRNGKARNHVCYNEQGAAFAACGYAQATNRCAIAYSTSGPGALNLISGIANAFYDSIPVVFITGQINTYEYKHINELRQDAFQETKTVDICKPITKYAVQITNVQQVKFELEKAYHIANTGRKGPVLIDLPMNIQRGEIVPEEQEGFTAKEREPSFQMSILDTLKKSLFQSTRPVLLLGNGISKPESVVFLKFAETLRIPVVTSLLGKWIIPYEHELNFGYIGGAYGHRYANMIVSGKSDLIIAVGCSLCSRQTGTKIEEFASNAKIIRFDVDSAELNRRIKSDEIGFQISARELAELLNANQDFIEEFPRCTVAWLDFCKRYKKYCQNFDKEHTYSFPNHAIDAFNAWIQPGDIVVGDVGQHMMWVAQSIECKENMTFLFSGGHGAMGYALPASIGATVSQTDRVVFCFCGDGAMQMNIQELQWLKNETLNIAVIVMNNNSLGLIAQQQEALFEKRYYGAADYGFISPNFTEIAQAYGISAKRVSALAEINRAMEGWQRKGPFLLEIMLPEYTKAYPKTEFGKKIYDQDPLLPRDSFLAFLGDMS